MRFLPAIFLASGAVAAAVGRSSGDDYDCVLAHRREMAADAADAGCGSHMAVSLCFSQLSSSEPSALADCYRKAGCRAGQAGALADAARDRCRELFPGDAELRRRHILDDDANKPAPKTTSPPEFAAVDIQGGLFPRSAYTGADDCLTTETTKTKVCNFETVDGSTNTVDCSSTDMPTSSCAPGKTCSMDSNGNDICMDLKDTLDVAGVIIAIVFGVSIALGIATLTFLCCRDRKEQKRLAAKAEATALARAATKKKRQAEQRAPLMREERRRDASASSTPGAGDPFHDRNRQ